jgi:hypothetical protein
LIPRPTVAEFSALCAGMNAVLVECPSCAARLCHVSEGRIERIIGLLDDSHCRLCGRTASASDWWVLRDDREYED